MGEGRRAGKAISSDGIRTRGREERGR